MTVKDVERLTGLSHQAIYKRIKAAGYALETIKNKASGLFTDEGEKIIMELFSIGENGSQTAKTEVADELQKLQNELSRLQESCKELRNQVASLEEQKKLLTDERDFLRVALDRSQHMEAAAISKLPTPPPALPAAEPEKRRGLRGLFDRMRGGSRGN